ncbi:hypothetical protein G6F40_017158 [Rhizopus arrhizus]|nr:hypothetical protein G6F40_017158 [Rhizopus arrhizus]
MGQGHSEYQGSNRFRTDPGCRDRHAGYPGGPSAQAVDGFPVPGRLHGGRPTAVGRCRAAAPHAAHRAGRSLMPFRAPRLGA